MIPKATRVVPRRISSNVTHAVLCLLLDGVDRKYGVTTNVSMGKHSKGVGMVSKMLGSGEMVFGTVCWEYMMKSKGLRSLLRSYCLI